MIEAGEWGCALRREARLGNTAGRVVRGLFVLIATLFLMLPVARADDIADWSGSWDTKWRGGGAELDITQNGADVTGVYPSYHGRIVAKASGRELRGQWFQDDDKGTFIFVLSPDGQSFMGRFEDATGEWWTGVRPDSAKYDFVRIDQSSPAATMGSFLQALNESGADNVYRSDGGNMGLASKAADLVEVSDADRGNESEIDYARQLFAVIDRLTFRIWDLPQESYPKDEVTVTLGQFETKVTFDLTFRKAGGKWFIVGPPLSELNAKRDELAAARGVPPDLVPDPTKLRSPRDAFKTLLGSLGTDDNATSETALDMRSFSQAVRNDEAELLAHYLKKVIDRVGYVYWQELPDNPASKVPFVFLEHPAGDIVVGPVETDDGVIWQFTQGTLSDIRNLYADIEDLPVDPEFASFAGADPYFITRSIARSINPGLLMRAGPIEQWQWVLLFVVGLVGLALGYIASWIVGAFRQRRRHEGRAEQATLNGVVDWSIRSIAFGLALIAGLRVLGLPELVATPVKALAWTAILIGAVPVSWQIIGRVADAYRGHWVVPGYHETLIALMTGLVRVVMIVVAFLLLAEVLAIPYQGVIAGLGIGGLAVALAAQPTLQNFLSGITLYADRPISVGDFCKFGDKIGTVEHIGMRSTRIRSPDRTIISVPNSEFANMQLENFARRDRIQFKTVLQLRQETTSDQLRYTLAELRSLLIAHPRVADDARVRFIGFGVATFDIELFSYIQTADNTEFLAVREDLLLRIMAILDEAGVRLAFPSQIEYRAGEVALDPTKREAAERKVAQWREAERLPFPDFDPARKAEMRNVLAYPPEGSVLRRAAEPVLPMDDAGLAIGPARGWHMPWRRAAPPP